MKKHVPLGCLIPSQQARKSTENFTQNQRPCRMRMLQYQQGYNLHTQKSSCIYALKKLRLCWNGLSTPKIITYGSFGRKHLKISIWISVLYLNGLRIVRKDNFFSNDEIHIQILITRVFVEINSSNLKFIICC